MLPFTHEHLQWEQRETWHSIKVKIPRQARLQSNHIILELCSAYLSRDCLEWLALKRNIAAEDLQLRLLKTFTVDDYRQLGP